MGKTSRAAKPRSQQASATLHIPSKSPRISSEAASTHEESRLKTLTNQIDSSPDRAQRCTKRAKFACSLEEEADRLVRRSRDVATLVSLLPLEYLFSIFLLASRDAYESGDERDNSPWRFCHVSRLWRKAALSYPQIWTFITILPTNPSSASLPSLLQAQLLLTMGAPLHISWFGLLGSPLSLNPHITNLMISTCSRWSSVRLSNFGAPGALDWLQNVLIAGRLPLLARLELFGCSSAEVPDVFFTAPRLRQVLLHAPFRAPSYNEISPSVVLPWNALTHYRAAYPIETHLQILRRSPNLKECVLGGYNHVFTAPGRLSAEPDPPILVLRLDRLYTQSASQLKYLAAPGLSGLSTSLEHAESPSLEALQAFLWRSTCSLTLTQLALLDYNISAPHHSELVSVLCVLPALTHLLVAIPKGEPSVLFNALAACSSGFGTTNSTTNSCDRCLCPRLTCLVYGYGSERDFPSDLFFAMVRSRSSLADDGQTLDVDAAASFQVEPSRVRLRKLRVFNVWCSSAITPVSFVSPMNDLRKMELDVEFFGRFDHAIVEERWGRF